MHSQQNDFVVDALCDSFDNNKKKCCENIHLSAHEWRLMCNNRFSILFLPFVFSSTVFFMALQTFSALSRLMTICKRGYFIANLFTDNLLECWLM